MPQSCPPATTVVSPAPTEPPGADADGTADHEAAADASPTKVDITIAGHTVVVEAYRSMEDVAAQALDLIHRTAGYARRMPAGFDTGPADTHLADGQPTAVVRARL